MGRRIDRTIEVLGVDNDPDAPRINTIMCDVSKDISWKSESFNWVFCKHVIEHVKDTEKMIEEAYRLLKPGGKIIIITQNWFYTHRVFFDDYQHNRPFMKSSLVALLKSKGFKIHHAEGNWYQLPFTWYFRPLKFFCWLIQRLPWCQLKLIKYSKEIQLLVVGCK